VQPVIDLWHMTELTTPNERRNLYLAPVRRLSIARSVVQAYTRSVRSDNTDTADMIDGILDPRV